MYYIIEYKGKTGFIKPFTSMRDSETNSEKYLPTSTINGIEKKLFGDIKGRILRYRLNFDNIQSTQEATQSIEKETFGKKNLKYSKYNTGIITRYILINPSLYLLFDNYEYAKECLDQHICLSRNEDILLPNDNIIEINNLEEFDGFNGYEAISCDDIDEDSVYMGVNKYTNKEQYSLLMIYGTPNNLK